MPNFKRNIFLLVFTLFMIGNVNAQISKLIVSGVLKDVKTKLPVEYANVLVKQKVDQKFVKGTVSDENGRFKLNNVFKLKGQTQIQFSGVYLAKDIIP